MIDNLEPVRERIEQALRKEGHIVFRSVAKTPEEAIRWNIADYDNPEEFLAVATQLGVKPICFGEERFHARDMEEAIEDMDALEDISRDDKREFQRELRRFKNYEGFLCALEITFLHEGQTYAFGALTSWFKEYLDKLEELDALLDPFTGGDSDKDDDDRGPGPYGYLSKN